MLKLRYFTPREVANLHGFPSEFCKFTFVYMRRCPTALPCVCKCHDFVPAACMTPFMNRTLFCPCYMALRRFDFSCQCTDLY